ncbi:MAG: RidA family protein [bacterium]|nr:RidA family protein [bacterium]
MKKRINISSGAKWEDIVGYSRAVRIDGMVSVSGTTSVDGDTVIGEDNFYLQTKTILRKIEHSLNEAGAKLQDVIRTRIYVTDITKWEEVGKAHGEFFKDVKPATSMIQISALIDPKMLVEIEVDAVIGR